MSTRRAAIAASLMVAVGLSLIANAPVAGATRKVALGVQMEPPTVETYNRFKASVGRAPAIWTLSRYWVQGDNGLGDLAFLRYLRSQGTTPLIWWLPADPNKPDPMFRYSRILRGAFDDYITDFATDAKEFGGRLILRPFHEMDGDWFPWRIRYPNTKRQFIAAWRHVVTIFREVGATNVKFLWNPNGCLARCPAGTPTMKSIYPGNAYVDYLGMSAFNWGEARGAWEKAHRGWQRWQTMVEVLRGKYTALTALASRKPVIVAELGSSTDAPRNTSKAGWIRTGYPAAWRAFPRIKAIVYFNVDLGDGRGNVHEHWSLTTPDNRPRAEYRRLLRNVRFQGRV
jgi:hypothetical protein